MKNYNLSLAFIITMIFAGVFNLRAETEYDYEYLDMPVLCKAVWFGCRMNYDETNHAKQAFYTVIGDKPLESWSERPYLQNEGIAYEFLTWQDDAVDFRNPLPAPGTYKYGEKESDGEKVLWQYSTIYKRDGNGNYEWERKITDGELNVSIVNEDDNDYYVYDLIATDEKGKTHHVTYKSRFVSYEDDSDGPSEVLCKDINVTAQSHRAYFKKISDDGKSMHIRILFSDMPYDEEYDEFSDYPGSVFYTELYAPYSPNGLANGTYDVTAEYGDAFTVQQGEIVEFAGVKYARGSFDQYVDGNSRVHWGVYDSGTLEVSGEGSARRIEGNFLTPEGFSVKFVYEGEINILNMPVSGLTQNKTLNLVDAEATFEYLGDINAHGDVAVWSIKLTPDTGTDGAVIELCTNTPYYLDGIMTGTYKASRSTTAWPGEYLKGKTGDTGMTGTWYMGNIDEDGIPGLYAPAASGDFVIENKGNNLYSLNFSFDDGLGHIWDGSWEGTPKMVKLGSGPDSSVSDIECDAQFRLEGRKVIVTVPTAISAYTASGHVIFSGSAHEVELPGTGVYIVTIDGKAHKINVK